MTVTIPRIARHLLMTHWQVRRAFPQRTLVEIENAIKASESMHVGQVRFAVEGALDTSALFRDQSPRERAIDVFSQLRIWDTECNNGVLIYLLLADCAVEIVADRGIHLKTDSDEWKAICRNMETAFLQSNFERGVVTGVQAVTQHLTSQFPACGAAGKEIPERPVVL